jgi:heptose-I-phosphate ethanolaminephosphotransferase
MKFKNYILKYINEVIYGRKYLLYSLKLAIYVFLPQISTFHSIKNLIATLTSVVLLLLISKISKFLFLFIAFISLLLNSIMFHLSIYWGDSDILSRLEVAQLSPAYEKLEYLSTYITVYDIAILIYFIFGIYLITIMLYKLEHSYKVLKASGIFLLIVSLIVLSSFNLLKNISPYKFIYKLSKQGEWVKVVNERNEYLRNNIIERKRGQSSSLDYDKVIIIMGESANRHHMGVYDYNIPTTPFLSKLIKNKNAIKFDNIISPGNQTKYAIPLELTDATVNNFYNFITSPSIISDFKLLGYKTYWLSNQGETGAADSYVTSIAHEADYCKIGNMASDMYGNVNYDEVLLSYFDQIKTKRPQKEVYIFHLIGSHFAYSKRYPKKNALFPHPKNIIEEYDNSIYYTDYVISQIFNRFKDQKILFIYLSDHAETINNQIHGHGRNPPFKGVFDTPLIIYSSINNKRLDNIYKNNKKHIYNMESFNVIVKYLVGIENNISKISNNTHVLSIKPSNIFDYDKLDKYK